VSTAVEVTGWRRSLATYTDRRVLMVLALGFSSGLPLLLTYTTLSAWLAVYGVKRSLSARLRWLELPILSNFCGRRWLIVYHRRCLWAGGAAGELRFSSRWSARRWHWALATPKHNLGRIAELAVLVAFLSASQDIVIDAWRVEILPLDLQGSGAAMTQAGYRIGMLTSGAGALFIADHYGWFPAYATMAAMFVVGICVFLFGPEPEVAEQDAKSGGGGLKAIGQWFVTAVAGPFADFMRRPLWLAILIFTVGYKLGEGMAAVMATPLYISLGFSLSEIAAVSKLFGVLSIVAGVLIGGFVTARFGIMRSLLLCGVLQSIGNLSYVLQLWVDTGLATSRLRHGGESDGKVWRGRR